MKGKILFTASTYGHIRNFHPPYLRQFAERGWRVHVACAGVPERVPYAEKAFALPFKKRIGSPANFRAACTLRRIISAEGYGLISSHTSLASFFTRLALLGMRNRPLLVNTVHGYLFDDETPPLKRSLLLGAERMAAGVTDLLMVMNRTDERIAETYGLGRRIVRIPGVGVNFAAFDEAKRLDKQSVRRELGLPADAFVLLYPAEFSDRKSQRVLIEAMPQLPESVILALPGDGARLEQCRALAEQKRRKILFPGYVTDMGKWYAAADALVSASRSEGLPFHIMEAMNMGLPVIASAVKGNADLIQDGKTGILYPYGNVNLFAADALRLMKDDALRTAMAERAREAVKQYDLNRVLPLVMRQYESVIHPV